VDGNMLEADLNQDDTVNFKDFAILANYWQQSTSGPEDLDDSGFIDYNDVSILAGQWLWITWPNIQLQISNDANNNFIDFGAAGYTSETQRIFLLMDGQCVGEIFGFSEGWPLGIDVSEYGGGEKQLKAVSIDRYGQVTCSNITSTDFNCPLNYCFLPSEYEPNKPLYFSAFNPSEGNVTVKVYADYGNLVWSQDYNGIILSGYIPAEITRQYEFDYINFEMSEGEFVGKATHMLKDPPFSSVRALMILPDVGLNFRDYRLISEVRKAFKDKGIIYDELWVASATYELVAKYGWYGNIKYMFIDAHGNYRFSLFPSAWVLRTSIKLYDFPVVSIKKSDPGAPSWCEDLWPFWEKRTKSFASMGFKNLKFVFSNSCYGGRLVINDKNQLIEGKPRKLGDTFYEELISDMSIALGIHQSIFENRLYQGWWGEPWTNFLWQNKWSKFSQDEWRRLGAGDNIAEALIIAFGGQTDFDDPNDPGNSYRLKAQGNFLSIKLE
jgi:hypothetical protein